MFYLDAISKAYAIMNPLAIALLGVTMFLLGRMSAKNRNMLLVAVIVSIVVVTVTIRSFNVWVWC